MNVAYVALAPFISGSERSLQITIIECQKKGVKPILICPFNSPLHEWAKANNVISHKAELTMPSLKSVLKYIKSQISLYYIFKKHNVELVHSNQIWSVSPVQLARKLLNIPLVTHFRDPIDHTSNWWLKGSVDGAIAISKHIEEETVENVSNHLITNLLCQINPVTRVLTRSKSEQENAKLESRAAIGISEFSFVFGCIGQVAPIKGIIELIQAFSNPQFGNDVLLIAGADPSENQNYLKECENLALKYNIGHRIMWLGHIDKTDVFYQAIDTVVMLSKREPLGRVPLEAGNHYKTAIVNNVDGLPETIENGVTGWLTNANDLEDVTEKMLNAKKANLMIMGYQANQFVKNKAAPEQYATTILNFYKKIINGKN